MESAPYSALFQSRYIGPYPYLEESTFREAITKFCQLGMLWCYCDDDDNIKFVSARPKLLQGELDRAYTWPNSRKYGTTTRDLFLRNRFRKVEVEVDKVTVDSSAKKTFNFTINEIKEDEQGVSNNIEYPASEDDFNNVSEENEGFVKNLNYSFIMQKAYYAYYIITFNLDKKQRLLAINKSLFACSYSGYQNDRRDATNKKLVNLDKSSKSYWRTITIGEGENIIQWESALGWRQYDTIEAFEAEFFNGNTLRYNPGVCRAGFVLDGEIINMPVLIQCQDVSHIATGIDTFITTCGLTIYPYSVSVEKIKMSYIQ